MNQPDQTTYDQTIQATFDQLEGCLAQAKSVVPVSHAQQLINLLPAASIESQRFILTELVKLDMSSAATMGCLRMLDYYLPSSQFWLGEQDITLDLILEEVQIRRDHGQVPSLLEYQQRFPRWSTALADIPWEQLNLRQTHVLPGLPELEPGQTIDDFRVVQQLGRGAFARVYLAMQLSMNRLVALKISSRGTDEPQLLSQLDHPNIVRVFDQRQLNSQKVHLLYMQAVLGGTVAGLIAATCERPLGELKGAALLELVDQALVVAGQQPPERDSSNRVRQMTWAETVAWLGEQLSDGLQSAHDQGVFHRDIKPANILLSAAANPKLADFNVSSSEQNQLESGMGGTLAYMSPEQLTAVSSLRVSDIELVDARSDMYSLAVVLWEVWQGKRPWNSQESADSWRKKVEQQLLLRAGALQLPRHDLTPAGRWLYQVLSQAIDHDPAKRPQSCRELGTRLSLAASPVLVARFAPAAGSMIDRLRRWPISLVVALITLTPNALAGLLNYLYNWQVIIRPYSQQLREDFDLLATRFNLIAFSIGTLLLIYFCWRVRKSLDRAQSNQPARPDEIDWVWRFGHRAALIGAALWLSFGLIYPYAIRWYQPEFRGSDFTHFFLSLALCGGIAWIYPFYGVSLLSTTVYYPLMLSPSIHDSQFSKRAKWLKSWANFYLASSAVIPLVALALIIVRPDEEVPSYLRLTLVVLTFLSIAFSYQAHQLLQRVVQQYESILARRTQT